MVVNKHTAMRMSCERSLLAGPEKIEMNDLQRILSTSEILRWLIQVGCLAHFHIRADIITGHGHALEIVKSLKCVDHLLNRGQRHISQSSMPANPFVLDSIIPFDFCISTGLYVKQATHRNYGDCSIDDFDLRQL